MPVIFGTPGSETINGTSGNDTIHGWNPEGNVDSPSGNDKLYGQSGNDELQGGTGRDILDGGLGIDRLYGGRGSDTYIMDNTIDTITEYFNQGTDTVKASVSFTLGNNLENLALTGSSNISGTGNTLNNTIIGNTVNNSLYGAAGADTLDGGLGVDSLYGGTGNDTYVVDSTTDNIVELLDQGYDAVESSVSYTLGGNLERLVLKGTGDLTGIGNALDNYIDAYTGNNTLNGGDGNDNISSGIDGSVGNDTLGGGTGNDYLSGANGSDHLKGGSGNDFLVGDYYDPLLGYDDILNGGTGDDTLIGSFGRDTLTGGAGSDNFRFDFTTEGIDTITDFLVAGDTIQIYGGLPDDVYGFGGGLTVGAAITPEQFIMGSAAANASDRFIYNQSTGGLFFDSDGTGAAGQVQLAGLSTGLAMTDADIFVIG